MAKRQNLTSGSSDLQAGLGRAIRRRRNELGLTQEELAWRANLHRTYIADIERGGRNITLRNIAGLAKALEVSVSVLLETISPDGTPARRIGEVLLVEDSPQDAEMTLRAFKRARLTNPVKWLRDGQEAMDYLFGPEGAPADGPAPRPDLVLLDLHMPRVSGIEVLKRLKSADPFRDIPVVVLSSSQNDQNITECARLGASHYIIKPVDFDNLSRVTPALSLDWALVRPVA